jgi:hypothetical protein
MNIRWRVSVLTRQFALETHLVEILFAMEKFFEANGVARARPKLTKRDVGKVR